MKKINEDTQPATPIEKTKGRRTWPTHQLFLSKGDKNMERSPQKRGRSGKYRRVQGKTGRTYEGEADNVQPYIE